MKNPKQGFAPILGIIIALAVIAVGGYFVYQKAQPNYSYQPTTPDNSFHTVPITPVPAVQNPDATKDWKTYKNEKYGFSFKYPSNLLVSIGPYVRPHGTGFNGLGNEINFNKREVELDITTLDGSANSRFESGYDWSAPKEKSLLSLAIFHTISSLDTDANNLWPFSTVWSKTPTKTFLNSIPAYRADSVYGNSTSYLFQSPQNNYMATYGSTDSLSAKILSTFRFTAPTTPVPMPPVSNPDEMLTIAPSGFVGHFSIEISDGNVMDEPLLLSVRVTVYNQNGVVVSSTDTQYGRVVFNRIPGGSYSVLITSPGFKDGRKTFTVKPDATEFHTDVSMSRQ